MENMEKRILQRKLKNTLHFFISMKNFKKDPINVNKRVYNFKPKVMRDT